MMMIISTVNNKWLNMTTVNIDGSCEGTTLVTELPRFNSSPLQNPPLCHRIQQMNIVPVEA